jgi:hypothetical protein
VKENSLFIKKETKQITAKLDGKARNMPHKKKHTQKQHNAKAN